MIVEKAHSPVYNDSDGTSISLMVKFDHLPSEVLYVATSNDIAQHSRLLYKNALEGKYGRIKLYKENIIQPVVSIEDITKNVLSKRNALLKESDGRCFIYFDKAEAIPSDLAEYRQALRDIPNQTGYPTSVVWPTKPF